MARKVAVEIVGDSRQLEKAFARSTKSAQKFERTISHTARGAASGTRLFHGAVRSLAFASGGFVAAEGVTSLLRDSVDAARDAGKAQRSLAAQMKASGESWADNQKQIEEVSQSYAKFGFQNDEVIKSLTVLERGTGKLSDAIRLQGLTADVARAKNIDLEAAASTVAKVFGGQETALRRAVPGLEKNAHGWDLIRLAQQKLAGQAAANTTASERFQAALHDTEELVGKVLLPILNRYLETLSRWLSNSKNQEQIANTVKAAMAALSAVIKTITAALGFLNKITGSTANTLKALFAILVAYKGLKLAGTLAGIATNIGLVGTESTVAAGAAAGFAAQLLAIAAAGVAAYKATQWFLKKTHLDKKLGALGGKIYDVTHGDPKKALTGSAFRYLRNQAARMEARGMTPKQAAAQLAATHPGYSRKDLDIVAGVGRGGVVITGNVTINGVQNAKQMEQELTKRAGARGHNRRGAR